MERLFAVFEHLKSAACTAEIASPHHRIHEMYSPSSS
jgi:hypothetical protein